MGHDYKVEGKDGRGTWGYCFSCGVPMYKPRGEAPRIDGAVVPRPTEVPDCQ